MVKFENSIPEKIELIKKMQQELNINIPPDYIHYLTKICEFEPIGKENTYGIYIIGKEGELIAPLANFFTLREIKDEISFWKDEFEFLKLAPHEKFLTIGHGHGQYRILMGNTNENLNKIYLMHGEDVSLEYVCDSINQFKKYYLAYWDLPFYTADGIKK